MSALPNPLSWYEARALEIRRDAHDADAMTAGIALGELCRDVRDLVAEIRRLRGVLDVERK